MSVSQLSEQHIATLAQYYVRRCLSPLLHPSDIKAIGETAQHLAWANMKNFMQRYEQKFGPSEIAEIEDAVTFAENEIFYQTIGPLNHSPTYILKIAQCYLYNSRYKKWDDCRARNIINKIISKAISDLPGYNDMPWEI